jgi:hypothetical protein
MLEKCNTRLALIFKSHPSPHIFSHIKLRLPRGDAIKLKSLLNGESDGGSIGDGQKGGQVSKTHGKMVIVGMFVKMD